MTVNQLNRLSGIGAFIVFAISLLVIGNLNSEFDFVNDYVSKLGARSEPHAIWWNIFGFLVVGMLLFSFGFTYGRIIRDKLAGWLLACFGIGFALTAIPFDLSDEGAPLSKAHTVAICLALAAWLFGLAKISSNKTLDRTVHRRANLAAVLLILSMAGFVAGLWSMPVTHRLVFIVVFGWTVWTAVNKSELIME